MTVDDYMWQRKDVGKELKNLGADCFEKASMTQLNEKFKSLQGT